MSDPSYECEFYLPSPLLTKEGNKEGRRLFFPFVSGRISEEGMRVG